MKPTHSVSAYRLQRIRDLLLERDLDQKQITEMLCMTDPRAVAAYLDYLRSQRQAHICRWREPGVNGHRWPVWRSGRGRSVPKPEPKSQAEVMRAYRTRHGMGQRQVAVQVACPFGALFV